MANIPQEPYFPANPGNLVGLGNLCANATATYTFNSCNIPGSVQTWEVSSSLQKISFTGSSTTLKASATASGEGWVKATFKNGASVTKKIKVGKPIANTPTGPDICIDVRGQDEPSTLPVSPGADTYKLVSSNPDFRINGSTSLMVSSAPLTLRYNAARAGTYTVTLTTTNSCGSTVTNFSVRAKTCSPGGGRNALVLSPNPSSSEIFIDRVVASDKSVTIFDGAFQAQSVNTGEEEFIATELYDSGGNLVRRQEFEISSERPSIEVSTLRKDNYFLKIIGKEIDEVHQIIVN